jgi:RNA polymerase sigma-70 factor (ECF subfamily)
MLDADRGRRRHRDAGARPAAERRAARRGQALKPEQQECIVLRFLQGLSVAETSGVMGRSEGAVKQLQLRAVRALAKLLPEDAR